MTVIISHKGTFAGEYTGATSITFNHKRGFEMTGGKGGGNFRVTDISKLIERLEREKR